MPVTRDEIDRAKQLCEKATKGPWLYHSRNISNAKDDLDYDDVFLGWDFGKWDEETKTYVGSGPPDSMRGVFERGWDMAFVAEARELLPKALAYIELLEQQIMQLR